MKINKLFQITVVIFLTITACAENTSEDGKNSSLKMRLDSDSSSVQLFPLPADFNSEIEGDQAAMDSLWYNFFAVYPEGDDPEMRDFMEPIKGVYLLKDSILAFRPKGGFKPGKYFARCYTPEVLQEPEDIVSKRHLNSAKGHIEFKFEIK